MLIIFIFVDLICHDHHPEEKHCPYNLKCECCFPVRAFQNMTVSLMCLDDSPSRGKRKLTCCTIRQPSQRFLLGTSNSPVHPTIAVYTSSRSIQLDARFDQACEPEHEKDKRAQHDYAGQELALGYKG